MRFGCLSVGSESCRLDHAPPKTELLKFGLRRRGRSARTSASEISEEERGQSDGGKASGSDIFGFFCWDKGIKYLASSLSLSALRQIFESIKSHGSKTNKRIFLNIPGYNSVILFW